jgi:murein DD-endopeptidase MepM/ murein hydrolase activator NlpD
VRFSRISSQFSKSRFHPVLKRRRAHNGVDFAAPIGTPVRSVADGVIVSAGYAGGSGNMVKIKHGARWQTAYLHLHRISKGIRKGLKVTRGQVIGSVGKTGLATGPHLHYSLYDRGRYVDPMKTQLPKMPGKYDPIPESKLKKAILKLEKASERVEFARLDKEHSPS